MRLNAKIIAFKRKNNCVYSQCCLRLNAIFCVKTQKLLRLKAIKRTSFFILASMGFRSFMPLIIFYLNCILLVMMKMNKKQFLRQSWNLRAEGRIPFIKFKKICSSFVFISLSFHLLIYLVLNYISMFIFQTFLRLSLNMAREGIEK